MDLDPNNPENLQPDNGGNNTDPPIVNDPVPAWHAALFESNRARQEAEERERRTNERLTQIENDRQEAARPKLEQGDAFNDPEKFRRTLMDDMARQVAPINNMMAEMQRKQDYFSMKTRLRSLYPNLAPVLNSLEPALDNYFLNNQGVQPTEANIAQQIKLIAGEIAINQLSNPGNNNPQPNNSPNNPNNPPTPVIPPSVRPSNRVPAPIVPVKTDFNSLSESERRLARENKMTPDEFILMRDTPADQADEVWRGILKARKGGK